MLLFSGTLQSLLHRRIRPVFAIVVLLVTAHGDGRAADLDAPLFTEEGPVRDGAKALVEAVPSTRDALARGVPGATIRNVPLAGGGAEDFLLVRFDVFTADGQVIVHDGAREVTVDRPALITYRGHGIDNPSRTIYLGISEGEKINLMVSSPKGGETYITPVEDKQARGLRHEISARDPEVLRDFFCDSDKLTHNLKLKGTMVEGPVDPRNLAPLESELLIDVGNPLYLQLGSNSAIASSYAANVIATVSMIYSRDLNIQLKIKQLVIWTSADPFSTSGSDTLAQLTAYENYNKTNRVGVSRDVAHLLTKRANFGGIAYVRSLCSTNTSYGVSNLRGNTSFAMVGYQWDAYVVAHELGHNFGSDHTHCFSPPIDCCYDQQAVSCSCTPVVAQQGTIMSYCHLNGSVALNFHSRCVSAMRTYTDGRSCITPPSVGLAVSGNEGLLIPHTDTTPSAVDGTAFGAVVVGTAGGAVRTFNVRNIGTSAVTLTGAAPVSVSATEMAEFSVASQPAAGVLQPGGSQAFQIRFTPRGRGARTATVSVAWSGGTYTFNVGGFSRDLQPAVTGTFTGATAVPDNSSSGVNIPILISGVSGAVADVNFLIGGSSCTGTGVGITHTWVGDLTMTLTSPSGTTAVILNRPGANSVASSGDHFCNTLFDDQADAPSISTISATGLPPLGPPYTGTFRPYDSFSIFVGENANGTWVVHLRDLFNGDVGTVRDLRLIITPNGEPTASSDWPLFE